MNRLLIALVLGFILTPTIGRAQEPAPRLTVDINYVGGGEGFSSIFNYPNGVTDPSMRTGKLYDTDGVNIAAKVQITDIVSAGYRFEHVGLRNAQNVDETNRWGRHTDPDIAHNGGSVQYQEFFGSFALRKTHGHALVVGVTKSVFERSWLWDTSIGMVNSLEKNSFTGLVVGGTGHQEVGHVMFDYSGRLYPHLGNATVWNGSEFPSQLGSTGYELRGTAMWSVANHVGLTGGYEFRRMRTDSSPMGANGQPWPTHENQDNQGLVVGTRLSF